ncbi:hypothetical protein Rumeso_02471 [Rubellimicrobium mesophilum DSM 19309]|uniref:Uncharacterized protein n=1 Tax=Rubellimicrobium mesophilum DSM 19309 TaxID=442562 RepID=A0A017HNL8_9RHOB|nr:hypothetical protein Rumeso_02471 [Rubellimicrobium mesophilum DSM 19309]
MPARTGHWWTGGTARRGLFDRAKRSGGQTERELLGGLTEPVETAEGRHRGRQSG